MKVVKCAWGCGTDVSVRGRVPAGGIGCGRGECLDRHNAAATAPAAPRRLRRPRRQPVVTGEWGMAVLLGRMGTQNQREEG